MNIIEKLNSQSITIESLDDFLSDNIDDVFHFFINQNHSTLSLASNEVNTYLSNNFKIIKKLNLDSSHNRMFIDLLIDVSERLNFSLYFQRLCRLKVKSKLLISKRNEATLIYINGLRRFQDFEIVLDDLLKKLQFAFEHEEDNDKRVLAIFFNFYANLILDFSESNFTRLSSFVKTIKQKSSEYSFLINDISGDIFNIDIVQNAVLVHQSIHRLIDNYLGREDIEIIFNQEKYLIELETTYAIDLSEVRKDFYSIRGVSSDSYNGSNSTFHSLGRGVAILTEEQQLFAYMHSYGKMHFAKCNYAFNLLESDFFINSIDIIDWGCGQAMASMSYLNFILKNNLNQKIDSITLNEPSEIALRRGALHVNKYNDSLELTTINKDINSIVKEDFNDGNSFNAKLHLFSNILDIDNYSTKHLTELIKRSFEGLNFFIIVSPFITDLKTDRIDNFIAEFEGNPQFELLQTYDKQKGEWKNNWTIVLRIFKAVI